MRRRISRSTSPALEALDELRPTLAARGIVFALARVKQDLIDDLRAFGLVDMIDPDRLFPTLPTAVEAYEQWERAHRRHDGTPTGGAS